MTKEEIQALPLQQRLVGYLKTMADFAVLGCRLRMTVSDSDWTEEDCDAWESLGEESDKWFYSLTLEERKFIEIAELTLCQLCRGETPGSDPLMIAGSILPK